MKKPEGRYRGLEPEVECGGLAPELGRVPEPVSGEEPAPRAREPQVLQEAGHRPDSNRAYGSCRIGDGKERHRDRHREPEPGDPAGKQPDAVDPRHDPETRGLDRRGA